MINTYSDEYKNCGGDGVVAGGKALVSGSFVVASDWLAYIASLLQKAKEEAKSKGADLQAQAQEGKEEAKSKGAELKGQAKSKGDELKGQAQDGVDAAKEKTNN